MRRLRRHAPPVFAASLVSGLVTLLATEHLHRLSALGWPAVGVTAIVVGAAVYVVTRK